MLELFIYCLKEKSKNLTPKSDHLNQFYLIRKKNCAPNVEDINFVDPSGFPEIFNFFSLAFLEILVFSQFFCMPPGFLSISIDFLNSGYYRI